MPNVHTADKVRRRKIRRAWKCTAIILTLGWLMIGCNPITMTEFLIMPWSNQNIPPKFNITDVKDEPTLLVLVQFPNGVPNLNQLNADRDLNDRLVRTLRRLYNENGDKVKIVPVSKVRSYLSRNPSSHFSKQKLGEQFKADYVLYAEILKMRTVAGGSMLLQGRADISVTLIDVHQPDGEGTVYELPYNIVYPKSGPRDAGDINPAQFRAIFLQRVARDVSRHFAAYPKEWRREMD